VVVCPHERHEARVGTQGRDLVCRRFLKMSYNLHTRRRPLWLCPLKMTRIIGTSDP
jgi:hypothetical protein